MRLYLAGPMRGLPEHGFPAFLEAEARLAALGHAVVSPARLSVALAADRFDIREPYEQAPEVYQAVFGAMPREQFMEQDLAQLLRCEAVAVLPGWESSEGARLEVTVALATGRPVLSADDLHRLDIRSDSQYVLEGEAAPGGRVADESGAVKADGGKARVDLLPVGPLLDEARVLGFGATNYADNNWRLGFAWSRIYGAALRHLFAWWGGEDDDPETGLPHLAHAACDVHFLMEFAATGSGKDDRWRAE
jgi:hypothetical protein